VLADCNEVNHAAQGCQSASAHPCTGSDARVACHQRAVKQLRNEVQLGAHTKQALVYVLLATGQRINAAGAGFVVVAFTHGNILSEPIFRPRKFGENIGDGRQSCKQCQLGPIA
jgi:hypothetical protein